MTEVKQVYPEERTCKVYPNNYIEVMIEDAVNRKWIDYIYEDDKEKVRLTVEGDALSDILWDYSELWKPSWYDNCIRIGYEDLKKFCKEQGYYLELKVKKKTQR